MVRRYPWQRDPQALIATYKAEQQLRSKATYARGSFPRSEAAPERPRPGMVSLVLRPFGYLLIGLVWSAIYLVIWCMGPGIAALIALTNVVPELRDLDVWSQMWVRLVSSPGELVVGILVLYPLLAVIWTLVLWTLPCCSLPLALLSFTYVKRSLQPRFAGEKLSFTSSASQGTTVGVTATDVALSLQPVHRSRWTDMLMRFYMEGWQPSFSSMLATLPGALGYLLVLFAVGSDTVDWARWVLGVPAGVLIVLSVVWLRRYWVRLYYLGPLEAQEAANDRRPLSELNPAEIARRRKRVEKATAARKTEGRSATKR